MRASRLAGAARRLCTAPPRKVNLRESFLRIKEPWSPHVAGDVNECQLKLARMQGEFVWHRDFRSLGIVGMPGNLASHGAMTHVCAERCGKVHYNGINYGINT